MITNIIKGFIIGTGKIIPGVSGSMLAISLNVYEKLLNIIANIKKINYSSLKFLISTSLGIIISIIIFSKIIKWSLKVFHIPIMLLFVGLILGGLPDIIKNIKVKKTKYNIIKYLFTFIVAFIFSIKITQITSINLISNSAITFFILGLIEAFSSIIPGISGTAIYMSLDVYNEILDLFSNLLNPSYIHVTLIFSMGILLGIYISAKIITFLLKKYKNCTFIAILGFMSSALILMIKEIIIYIIKIHINKAIVIHILIGIILFYIGTKITTIINNLCNN